MNKSALITYLDKQQLTDSKLFVVGISGFGGAGKTTLANFLVSKLQGAETVSIDDFIIGPWEQRSTDWATFDRDRLRREILEIAKPNRAIKYIQYHSGEFAAKKPGHWRTINPKRFLIIEGCGILHPKLMKYYDYSLWIDCPQQVALDRGKKRERAQNNGREKYWDTVWGPNDLAYFKRFRPDKLADTLIAV